MLTRDQAEQFHDQGFLALEAAFPREAMAQLREATSALVESFDTNRHRTVFSTTDRDSQRDEVFFRSAEAVEYFLEDEALDEAGELRVPADRAINKLGHALHDHVPAFKAFCRQPLIGNALQTLGLQDPLLWQTMLIFKQPGIGGEVRWHQDASYLITEPPGVVGLWVALEDADRENGCLWVAPGAHRTPLRERYTVDWTTRQGTLETLDDTPWPTESEGLALEVPEGSLVLFSDHMPHYSSANRSPRSRLAFTMHVADASARWAPENWLQRHELAPFHIK